MASNCPTTAQIEYPPTTDYITRLELQLRAAGYTNIDFWHDLALNTYCAQARRPDGTNTAIHTSGLGVGAAMCDLTQFELHEKKKFAFFLFLRSAGSARVAGTTEDWNQWLDKAEVLLYEIAEFLGSLRVLPERRNYGNG